VNPHLPNHIPVLGREAVEMLKPRQGGIYVDATFGAGGYSRAILDCAGTRVIGIDRDRSAISAGFDLVDRSDLILIGTPHKLYKQLDFHGKRVIDVWNLLGKGTAL